MRSEFLLCFSPFKITEICFGSTKMGIFLPGKAFHAVKKNQENDFAPLKKYSSYALKLITACELYFYFSIITST